MQVDFGGNIEQDEVKWRDEGVVIYVDLGVKIDV